MCFFSHSLDVIPRQNCSHVALQSNIQNKNFIFLHSNKIKCCLRVRNVFNLSTHPSHVPASFVAACLKVIKVLSTIESGGFGR